LIIRKEITNENAIIKMANIELKLARKIPVGEHTFWYIYVDAITGEKLKTQQMFMTVTGVPPQRTTETQTVDNTNQNTNIPKTGEGNYLY
jgi:hypothetical protein